MLRSEGAVDLYAVGAEEQDILDCLGTARQALSYFDAPLLSDLGQFDDPDQAKRHLAIIVKALEIATSAMNKIYKSTPLGLQLGN
ncbi:hypothetical protein [Sphingomonas carotinifaciens]|uniref:Uncharacterized protein n=1 Tax=Sphingomonas carotinifaciens TaxID=1166323 RepID=A0A6N8LVY8_9SPHN|nr:hypothetical protein [Sphingomonas carotinifaciens]MBB4084450.1 hypothetical protein [Sphingomonas carotinifaciens]MWC43851.1 hypothetical protein [Sphingomonas carotinifaciens]